MKKGTLGFMTILGLGVLLLGGCNKQFSVEENNAQISNPASVYCEENEGSLFIEKDEYGNETGLCLFEDGSYCEERSYYRNECQIGEIMYNTDDNIIGMPNLAAVYCVEQGGILSQKIGEGGEYALCLFEDGSYCEEWAFFRGECKAGNVFDEESGLEKFNLNTEIERIEACADRVGFYLNTNNYDISWEEESEGGASFVRNGHVVYTKQGENAEDDVECVVDMVDGSVTVEFSNHIYNGELQEDITESAGMPVTKMRVLEGQTEEETQAMIESACSNAGGELADGLCIIGDKKIAF